MDVVATVADSESPAAFAPEPDEAWAAADPRGILFAGHPLPMWVFDRRNRSFLAVNDAAVRKYGYSREEFLAMTLGQVCSPEERARPGRAPRELLESDPGGPGDVRKHRAKSGQVLRMQVASSRVRLQGREAVLSVLHDVSPAQRAALGDALTHLLSGHSTGPPDKAMQCLCGWLGFEAAELWAPEATGYRLVRTALWISPLASLSNPGALAWTPTALDSPRGEMARVWAGGEPAWVEEAGLGAGCRDRAKSLHEAGIFNSLLFPVRGLRGILGVVALLAAGHRQRDARTLDRIKEIGGRIGEHIEHCKGADELRKTQVIFRDLFDLAPVPYQEIDRRGILVRVNREECRILGFDASDMVGRPTWDFVGPEERDESRAVVDRMLKERRVPPPCEREFRDREGAAHIFQLHQSLITDALGEVTGIRTAMLDLTEARRSRQRIEYQAGLLDQVADAIITVDRNLVVTSWNGAAQRVFGYAAEEVIGKPYEAAVGTHFSRAERRRIHAAIRSTGSWRADVVCASRSGDPIIVDFYVSALRGKDGKASGAIGIHRDITARRRAEDALRRSEDRLKLAQTALSIGSFEIDLRTGERTWSEQLCRLYGIPPSREAPTERQWLDCIHPEDRERMTATLEVSAGQPDEIDGQFRVVWPDGAIRWIHGKTRRVDDEAGQPVKVIGVAFDITADKLAEQRLRILSEAVEQSPVSVVITDLAGNIEYVNSKTTESTGYALEELKGKNPRILKSGRTSSQEYGELWKTIRTGEWRGTFLNRKKNGGLFWEEATIRPIRDAAGAPTHYLAVKEDITARKLVEEKIAWLASFPEQNPSPTVEIEVPSGAVRYANPAARFLFPDVEKEGLAHPWLAGLERVAEELAQSNRDLVTRDVVVGDLCVAQAVHYLPEQRRLRVYGTDITERKRAENALLRSETKFRALYDSTSDAVMLLDEKGFFDCNKAALAMFGCATREEFCSKQPGDMSPPQQPGGTDSMTLANRHIATAMEKGSHRFEWVHRRLDTGEAFPAEVLLNAMELDGKRLLQGVVRDITQRKRAEDALRESEVKYRTLVTHIPQRIIHKDRESVFVSCNDLFARDLGIPAADIAGKTDFDIYPRELAEKYRADDRRIMDLRRTVELEEDRMVDGKPCTVFSVRTPVISEQGEVIGVLVVFTDITERKRAEEALRQSERQLRLAQKLESIGQLAAGIAHEINTPIQYIGDNGKFLEEAFRDLTRFVELHRAPAGSNSGPAQALEQGIDVEYLQEEIPKAIEQLLQGVDNVARIVRALKEFSHPGPVEKRPMDINRAIGSTILVSRNEWKYLADLTTDFDADLPPVPCIAGEFNQVILNLIVNAAHAIADVVRDTGRKGSIRIGTRRQGDWAEIRVGDTGTGIPEAIQSKVFDPFFTTKEVGKGSGQGLSIAHAVIVQKHGGTIKFETQAGAGTTFIIQLPLECGLEET